ncbi:bifunctional ornithine acetyltransferase/N-acetylglutamate synthase [Peribacillus butanolivorans]|uniref:bifunctional ornithine acetyltransferase/N-acetylglutamate synthase n=1 Tax=Peribacillus butanolivorans TaxID=421767 RepID=UPI0020D22F69|nr:bifunctional ornithine acetyltransferase/N-acetylglutamate synthase [Peribacillus butanolivorans]
MANGLNGEVDIADLRNALNKMSIEQSKEIACDVEGATKLLEVVVEETAHFEQAKKVAKSIVNSPLVKTAVFGTDPNWGRIAIAIGKCDKELEILPGTISISFGNIPVFEGKPVNELELTKVKYHLQETEIVIRVSLNLGKESATVWGCDLS